LARVGGFDVRVMIEGFGFDQMHDGPVQTVRADGLRDEGAFHPTRIVVDQETASRERITETLTAEVQIVRVQQESFTWCQADDRQAHAVDHGQSETAIGDEWRIA
jgi:hypothetical protein